MVGIPGPGGLEQAEDLEPDLPDGGFDGVGQAIRFQDGIDLAVLSMGCKARGDAVYQPPRSRLRSHSRKAIACASHNPRSES